MTIQVKTFKQLERQQNRLHRAGYTLDDYNEYLQLETWRKNNSVVYIEFKE